MPKRKGDLNTIYISERLQECLRPIARCGLTIVVAPMGYGKTTAVNWYLSQRAQEGPVHIVRVSVYSDNLAILEERAGRLCPRRTGFFGRLPLSHRRCRGQPAL